jgi:hypothetical protein
MKLQAGIRQAGIRQAGIGQVGIGQGVMVFLCKLPILVCNAGQIHRLSSF